MHVKQFGLKVFEWCLPQLDYAFHILASILTEKDILYIWLFWVNYEIWSKIEFLSLIWKGYVP